MTMTAGDVSFVTMVEPSELVFVMGMTIVVEGVGKGVAREEGAARVVVGGGLDGPAVLLGRRVSDSEGVGRTEEPGPVFDGGGDAEESPPDEGGGVGVCEVSGVLPVTVELSFEPWRFVKSWTAATMSLLARWGSWSCTLSRPCRPLSKTPSLNWGRWPWRAAWRDSSGKALSRSWKSCLSAANEGSVGEGGTSAMTVPRKGSARRAIRLKERMAVVR